MSSQPLIPRLQPESPEINRSKRLQLISTLLVALLLVGGTIFIGIVGERVPTDPNELADYWLKSSPVIDGHVDLPILVREVYGNNIDNLDLNKKMPGHFDLPRARKGRMGGFFWSIFMDCKAEAGPDFLNATNTVRDTLEVIDVALNLIDRYPDFKLCRTAADVMWAIKEGKIASLLGMEGAHMLGNSLGALRMYHRLGIRYLTLTHGCNNAFADSGGVFEAVKPKWGGLSPLGRDLVKELNRLGILVDLSHVSDDTALQALEITRAPVILSHSDARHFNNLSRNVPDKVLDKIGKGHGKKDGVVMVNFYPTFASSTHKANVSTIVDQVEYISDRIGRKHVGIGSDYDGIESTPDGLEDVSKYPNLFAELIRRGWTHNDLSLLAGGNVLRILNGAEAVAAQMADEGEKASMAVYDKRTDLDPKPFPPHR